MYKLQQLLSHSKRVIDASSMAARAVLTLNEVIDELENLDKEISDDSEDDFVGYLDESER